MRTKLLNKNFLIPSLLFLAITLVALLIRFHNYDLYVNFHLDPPLFLREVKDMVDEGKPRLIGPMVSSKEIEGRVFFTGPTLYYLLAVLGLVLNWNVLAMTGFFAILWLITFALIFFWLKQKFGLTISLIIYALLALSPWFLPFSRIIWNPNLVPFLGILFFWSFERRKNNPLYYFIAGLFFGLGLSIHYATALWLIVVLYYFFKDWLHKNFQFRSWIFLGIGFVVAELPFLIFELRHSFYNLQTVLFHIRYYKPSETYSFGFSSGYYYYVLPFLPLFAYLYALILKRVQSKFGQKYLLATQIVLIFFSLFYSVYGPRREALINPAGWSIPRQQRIADIIVADAETPFEVAATVGPETRANEIRWWLRQRNHNPMGVDEYPSATVLYLVAPESRPPDKETVWEVKSLAPFKVEKKIDLGEGMFLYKLRRT